MNQSKNLLQIAELLQMCARHVVEAAVQGDEVEALCQDMHAVSVRLRDMEKQQA